MAVEGDGAVGERAAPSRVPLWTPLKGPVPHTRFWATDRLGRYAAAAATTAAPPHDDGGDGSGGGGGGLALLCDGLADGEAAALARALNARGGAVVLEELGYELPECAAAPASEGRKAGFSGL